MQGQGSVGNVFATNLIVSNSGGWFLYTGTPALGNPPVAWASGGTLKDPYGNVLPNRGPSSVSGGAISTMQSGLFQVGNTSWFFQGLIQGTTSGPSSKAALQIESPLILNTDVGSAINMISAPAGNESLISLAGTLTVGSALVGGSNTQFTIRKSQTGEADIFSPTQTALDTAAEIAMLSSLQTGGFPLIHAVGSFFTADGNITANGGNVDVSSIGNGLRVAEGSNAKQGTAVLVAGTVTVSNTAVTANSRIMLTSQVDGGTPGFLRVSSRTAGTSFVIKSGSATDTSTVAYEIFEPG